MKKQTIALAAITVMALTGSFTTLVVAQSDAARMIYQSAATVETNVAGIRTYPQPEESFKPAMASDEDLARYGFPPRPNKNTNPQGYAMWERAMQAAKHRWTGPLTPHPEAMSTPMMPAKRPAKDVVHSDTVTTEYTTNWSGVGNSNTLTKWNPNTSFDSVYSQFNVPVVQQAFDVCDGGYDWEVTWNGIDGFKNGTVLQGGSSSQAYCKNNNTKQIYYAWIEWYPSYPIVEAFGVNPGDDMYVNSYSPNGGCNPGQVFVEDETTLAYGTYQLTWENGPCLVGNGAEIVVERPYGDSGKNYPLANYIWDFALSWDYEIKGTEFYPGITTPATYVFQMVDDNDTQVISVPNVEGKLSVFFYDTNCAYTGGCVF